jgi:hypothetical protein
MPDMSEKHEVEPKFPPEQPEVTDREGESATTGEQGMPRADPDLNLPVSAIGKRTVAASTSDVE